MPFIIKKIDGERPGAIGYHAFTEEEVQRVAEPDSIVEAVSIATRRVRVFRGSKVQAKASKARKAARRIAARKR